MEQLDKTWSNWTKHGTTGQNMKQLDKTWSNRTKHGLIGQNMEQLEKTWNNRTKHEATEQNMEQLDKTVHFDEKGSNLYLRLRAGSNNLCEAGCLYYLLPCQI
jgi:hypothetical protein